jgi:hypothetical protein
MSASGRKTLPHNGLKLAVRGRNRPVKVKCSPTALRWFAALRFESKLASDGDQLGATTITEVALSRPRCKSSRMAALTAGEMP